MKMIKLSEGNYVVVDDTEIKKGDWIGFPNLKKFVPVQYLGGDLTGYEKGITHSTQPIEEWKSVSYGGDGTIRKKIYDKIKPLSLQEVKELLGEVDVEKKAAELAYSRRIKYQDSFHDGVCSGLEEGYEIGYNQALEDKKDKKYTEKDLLDAYTWGFLEGTERRDDVTDSVNKFSQSLHNKTEWDVEFSNGKLKLV